MSKSFLLRGDGEWALTHKEIQRKTKILLNSFNFNQNLQQQQKGSLVEKIKKKRIN